MTDETIDRKIREASAVPGDRVMLAFEVVPENSGDATAVEFFLTGRGWVRLRLLGEVTS